MIAKRREAQFLQYKEVGRVVVSDFPQDCKIIFKTPLHESKNVTS